jgi:AraC-like DNA-binding protein
MGNSSAGSFSPGSIGRVSEAKTCSEQTGREKRILLSSPYAIALDEVRFEVARHLVVDTNMPLVQISAVLDFSEPAAFTRAFQRWSGVSPSQLRSQQKAVLAEL